MCDMRHAIALHVAAPNKYSVWYWYQPIMYTIDCSCCCHCLNLEYAHTYHTCTCQGKHKPIATNYNGKETENVSDLFSNLLVISIINCKIDRYVHENKIIKIFWTSFHACFKLHLNDLTISQ